MNTPHYSITRSPLDISEKVETEQTTQPNKRRSACVGLMMGQRRRRWPTINPAQVHSPMFDEDTHIVISVIDPKEMRKYMIGCMISI